MGHYTVRTNQMLSALSTKYWIIAAREEMAEWEKNVQHVLEEKPSVQNRLWHPCL